MTNMDFSNINSFYDVSFGFGSNQYKVVVQCSNPRGHLINQDLLKSIQDCGAVIGRIDPSSSCSLKLNLDEKKQVLKGIEINGKFFRVSHVDDNKNEKIFFFMETGKNRQGINESSPQYEIRYNSKKAEGQVCRFVKVKSDYEKQEYSFVSDTLMPKQISLAKPASLKKSFFSHHLQVYSGQKQFVQYPEELNPFACKTRFVISCNSHVNQTDFELEKVLEQFEKKEIQEKDVFDFISKLNKSHASRRVELFFATAEVCKKNQQSSLPVKIGGGMTYYQTGMGSRQKYKVGDVSFHCQAAHSACLPNPTTNIQAVKNRSAIVQLIKKEALSNNAIQELRKNHIHSAEILKLRFFEQVYNQLPESIPVSPELDKLFFQQAISISKNHQLEEWGKLFGFEEQTMQELQRLIVLYEHQQYTEESAIKECAKYYQAFCHHKKKNVEGLFTYLLETMQQSSRLSDHHVDLLALFGLDSNLSVAKSGVEGWLKKSSQSISRSLFKDLKGEVIENWIVMLEGETPLITAPSFVSVDNHQESQLHFYLQETKLLPDYINGEVDFASDKARLFAVQLLTQVSNKQINIEEAVTKFVAHLTDLYDFKLGEIRESQAQKWSEDNKKQVFSALTFLKTHALIFKTKQYIETNRNVLQVCREAAKTKQNSENLTKMIDNFEQIATNVRQLLVNQNQPFEFNTLAKEMNALATQLQKIKTVEMFSHWKKEKVNEKYKLDENRVSDEWTKLDKKMSEKTCLVKKWTCSDGFKALMSLERDLKGKLSLDKRDLVLNLDCNKVIFKLKTMDLNKKDAKQIEAELSFGMHEEAFKRVKGQIKVLFEDWNEKEDDAENWKIVQSIVVNNLNGFKLAVSFLKQLQQNIDSTKQILFLSQIDHASNLLDEELAEQNSTSFSKPLKQIEVGIVEQKEASQLALKFLLSEGLKLPHQILKVKNCATCLKGDKIRKELIHCMQETVQKLRNKETPDYDLLEKYLGKYTNQGWTLNFPKEKSEWKSSLVEVLRKNNEAKQISTLETALLSLEQGVEPAF
jgi:hypothetical protein